MTTKLEKFFNAESFCVVGASTTENKPGNVVAYNFVHSFPGKTYLVNPKGGELFGNKLYKSVLEIEDKIEAACIIVPARFTPQMLEQCGKKGIKNIIVTTGGFSEIGDEGKVLQQQMLQIMKDYNINVVGPNCLGLYSPALGYDTMFLPDSRLKRPKNGSVSIFTQSGAFGAAFIDQLSRLGSGQWVSKFISYGNASDINETDSLEYVGQDPDTRLILIYLEDFKEGRRFMNLAREISLKKPIMGIKANRTETGAKAGASHTAALSSNDAIVDDLLRDAGIIRVITWDQLEDCVLAFGTQPLPLGDRVAIITDGGGAGVMASDMVSDCNLKLAEFSPEIQNKLDQTFPSFYATENPVDITGSATAEDYRIALETVYDDPNVDSIVNLCVAVIPDLDIDEYINITKELAKRKEKPIATSLIGGEEAVFATKELLKEDIPVFDSPGRAVRALGMLSDYSKYLRKNGIDPKSILVEE
ncbi:MAG: CoA-binding protein [Candidatus Heimdallarchaeota archaeon]|nr:CoA-binding protein [Candidatus Heimdallarchaeota archaeon]MCK4769111.1 CoA-binding protein [Candidatus Heimdallarchaeota archaeon]